MGHESYLTYLRFERKRKQNKNEEANKKKCKMLTLCAAGHNLDEAAIGFDTTNVRHSSTTKWTFVYGILHTIQKKYKKSCVDIVAEIELCLYEFDECVVCMRVKIFIHLNGIIYLSDLCLAKIFYSI